MSGANEIGFSLKKITTEQFALIEDAYAPGETVDFSTQIKFGLNREKLNIGAYIEVRFAQKETCFLLLETLVTFCVEESAWQSFLQHEEEKIIVPQGFLTHLAMIAVGTTRGVLHAKTENTVFNRFIVPAINVAERITADGVFQTTK